MDLARELENPWNMKVKVISIAQACDVFKVKYIIANFKAVFSPNLKILLIFSTQINFLRYKLLLEMYGTVL